MTAVECFEIVTAEFDVAVVAETVVAAVAVATVTAVVKVVEWCTTVAR